MQQTNSDSKQGGLAGAMSWLDARFPATETFEYHMSKYYAPKNFNFFYYFGWLATFVLVNQLVTGIWLTMNYVPSGDAAFASVEYIMRDVEFGWLIRYLHSTGCIGIFHRSVFTHVPCATLRLISRAARIVVAYWHGHFHCANGGRVFWLPAALGQHVLLGRTSDCVTGRRNSPTLAQTSWSGCVVTSLCPKLR